MKWLLWRSLVARQRRQVPEGITAKDTRSAPRSAGRAGMERYEGRAPRRRYQRPGRPRLCMGTGWPAASMDATLAFGSGANPVASSISRSATAATRSNRVETAKLLAPVSPAGATQAAPAGRTSRRGPKSRRKPHVRFVQGIGGKSRPGMHRSRTARDAVSGEGPPTLTAHHGCSASATAGLWTNRRRGRPSCGAEGSSPCCAAFAAR